MTGAKKDETTMSFGQRLRDLVVLSWRDLDLRESWSQVLMPVLTVAAAMVLLDLGLAVRNGVDAARQQILERHPDLRVVQVVRKTHGVSEALDVSEVEGAVADFVGDSAHAVFPIPSALLPVGAQGNERSTETTSLEGLDPRDPRWELPPFRELPRREGRRGFSSNGALEIVVTKNLLQDIAPGAGTEHDPARRFLLHGSDGQPPLVLKEIGVVPLQDPDVEAYVPAGLLRAVRRALATSDAELLAMVDTEKNEIKAEVLSALPRRGAFARVDVYVDDPKDQAAVVAELRQGGFLVRSPREQLQDFDRRHRFVGVGLTFLFFLAVLPGFLVTLVTFLFFHTIRMPVMVLYRIVGIRRRYLAGIRLVQGTLFIAGIAVLLAVPVVLPVMLYFSKTMYNDMPLLHPTLAGHGLAFLFGWLGPLGASLIAARKAYRVNPIDWLDAAP